MPVGGEAAAAAASSARHGRVYSKGSPVRAGRRPEAAVAERVRGARQAAGGRGGGDGSGRSRETGTSGTGTAP